MGITVRAREDHMVNDQISPLIEAMEIDPEIDLSTIRKGTGKTMGLRSFSIESKERLLIKYFISPTKKWST